MDNIARHPSSPRKTPPPPVRQLPTVVTVCARCADPVMPAFSSRVDPILALLLFLLGIVPGLIYLAMAGSARVASCPRCGSGSDLVPLDSTRARELLGERYDDTVTVARQLAVEHANAARIAAEREHRLAVRLGLVMLAAVVLVSALAFAWHRRAAAQRAALDAELAATVRQAAEEDAARRAAEAAATRVPERRSEAEKVVAHLTILADGVALGSPKASAEPVMRVTAGETYVVGEERDGWIRLGDAPTEAWVAASAVRR